MKADPDAIGRPRQSRRNLVRSRRVMSTRWVANALLLVALVRAPAARSDEPSAPGPLVAGQVTSIAGWAARLTPGRGISTTSTAWLGARVLPHLDVYVSPELAAGDAPGGYSGLVNLPDADLIATRPAPQVYLARAAVRWGIGIGGERERPVRIGRGHHLVPRMAPARELTLTAGVFSPTEAFDQLSYACDPRTQFTQGALVGDATWDYPQDAHGYTRGALASLVAPRGALRAALFQVARAPGSDLDWDLSRSYGAVVELELDPRLRAAAAAVRLRAWRNAARLGSYRRALELRPPGSAPDLASAHRRGAVEWGLGLGAELGTPDHGSGAFIRAGWKGGGVEPLASGEADWAASAGAQLSGRAWHRSADAVAIATAVSGLSRAHARYLAAGGSDANLGPTGPRSAPERVVEAYYAFAAAPWFVASAGAELVTAPGADGGRAPLFLLWVRIHVER